MMEITKDANKDHENKLTTLNQQIANILTLDPDYVPIRGVRHQNIETDDFDLDQHMDDFFAKERKVMLLLGNSGAGKSLYAQFLMQRLWQQYVAAPEKNPLPLFISLSLLKTPINHAIEETLESYGLTTEQIATLKQTQQFIFILDAYDEIRKDKNLVVTNKLGEWNVKIVVTCRTNIYLHWSIILITLCSMKMKKRCLGFLLECI